VGAADSFLVHDDLMLGVLELGCCFLQEVQVGALLDVCVIEGGFGAFFCVLDVGVLVGDEGLCDFGLGEGGEEGFAAAAGGVVDVHGNVGGVIECHGVVGGVVEGHGVFGVHDECGYQVVDFNIGGC